MSLEHSPSDPHHVAPRRALASEAAAARSRRLGLTGPRSRLWPILLSTLVCAACPRAAAAQACGSCAPPPGLARAPVGELTPSPDQSLELDAPAPRRRAASYADLGALLRARVRVGALVAPWASPWAWACMGLAIMGQASMGPPWAIKGRDRMGRAIMGPHMSSWAGP